jgi:hypothetical protein
VICIWPLVDLRRGNDFPVIDDRHQILDVLGGEVPDFLGPLPVQLQGDDGAPAALREVRAGAARPQVPPGDDEVLGVPVKDLLLHLLGGQGEVGLAVGEGVAGGAVLVLPHRVPLAPHVREVDELQLGRLGQRLDGGGLVQGRALVLALLRQLHDHLVGALRLNHRLADAQGVDAVLQYVDDLPLGLFINRNAGGGLELHHHPDAARDVEALLGGPLFPRVRQDDQGGDQDAEDDQSPGLVIHAQESVPPQPGRLVRPDASGSMGVINGCTYR